MKCKDYYWLYINGTTCTAKGPKKWEKELIGILIGRQNLITLQKYAMKTDYENSTLSYSID